MEFIISFLSEWGYLALFICMVLENMNIPIPSEIILGFAGFLVSQDYFLPSGLQSSSEPPPVLRGPWCPTIWAPEEGAT